MPNGFKFIIHHDSELQPDVKVTSYRNALGVEKDGLGSGPSFGGETIYNVPYMAKEVRSLLNFHRNQL